jgi:AraC family transcriptional regulator of adaptative response / DNA-3-methyladenine glycosylase II
MVSAFGERIGDGAPEGLTHVFPSARALAARTLPELRAIGLTTARTRTLLALAGAIADGSIVLAVGADVDATRNKLEALPGIGPWTSNYIAMRALGWPDAFVDSDLVVKKAMGETSAARVRARSEAWRPWRAYAVMHLWRNS